ncbi:helix-turn-helix domain-containing protein [Amycolatopsis thailandensis]|uniref:XRE family transcriptional regulator n=1 Tax=Amycolatopsis thailandensis TaxID=589330 RepID=A0A229SIE2_9PSEU|nr:XRE family transcriptional regulator [Amycolatopsis thailandensis]OXM58638.1 XRE family transcriptional regulator [Amycolatopsis thailandensis]
MESQPTVTAAIELIAPRLRRAREKKGTTLVELSRATGISTSTLSRLESGQRKPSLELVLPVIAALGLRVDEIVSSPRVLEPIEDSRVLIPLTRHENGPRACKMTIPAVDDEPRPRTHDGREWLYVLRGRLRLVLGDQDVVLGPGEAAEFDCRTPHWFGATGRGRVEVLSLFGKQGERIHVRARTR